MLYNNYLATAGGGERSSLHFASALSDLGYSITFAVDQAVGLRLDDVMRPFGIEAREEWSLREYRGIGELYHSVINDGFEVFVNHTYNSFARNYAPIGFYSAMFPSPIGAAERECLGTYRNILCISSFTEQYVRRYWGEDLSTDILVPPISELHFERPEAGVAGKERLILCVGRFNVFGHNKNQLEAIRAFRSFIDGGILGRDWRLVIVGHINPNPETLDYVARCRALAEGYPIEIFTNLPLSELQSLYRRASYLWQLTGLGLDFGETPELCEHLGLVALDCFPYGVLPIAYQRTGVNSIIEEGRSGYTFANVEDLGTIMQQADSSFGTSFHEFQAECARRAGQRHTFSAYREQLEKLLRDWHLGPSPQISHRQNERRMV
jgi:glycosyltransferase involved in cell wall biosynthesis